MKCLYGCERTHENNEAADDGGARGSTPGLKQLIPVTHDADAVLFNLCCLCNPCLFIYWARKYEAFLHILGIN